MEISGKQFKIKETSSCSFQVNVETVFWLSQKTGSTKIAKSKIQKRLLRANLKLQSTYVCWGHWITTKTLLEQCMKRWEKQGKQIQIDRQTGWKVKGDQDAQISLWGNFDIGHQSFPTKNWKYQVNISMLNRHAVALFR